MPYRKDLNIIVSSEKQEEVCLKAGYKNVFKGGLPIIYTQDSYTKEVKILWCVSLLTLLNHKNIML